MDSSCALECRDISKTFKNNGNEINILSHLNLKIEKGGSTVLIGPSGSGKTTLLQIMGLLSKPSSGELIIDNVVVDFDNKKQIASLLKIKIGFIHQFHHLFSDFNVIENIMMPLLMIGKSKKEAKHEAEYMLERLGLADRMFSMPHLLSGGERQRVAVARAIIKKPSIILADEPTGSLDPDTAKTVFNEILTLSRENGSSLFMITHNHDLKDRFDAKYMISDKKLIPLE